MGLDMYLQKARLHGHTVEEMNTVSDYLDWQKRMKEYLEKGEEERICSFKEWCNKEVPSKELVEELKSEVHEVGEFCHWLSGFDEIGYWRKANQIHNWFVENVQNGEDDCGTYAVSKEQLEKLLGKCEYILDNVTVVKGLVKNGSTYKNGEWIDNYEDGETLDELSQALCASVLPTTSGFFFGGTDYDQYYLEDIKSTVEIIKSALANTDFENETVCYSSSW